jgi:general secretion pathway protein A
VNFLDYYGLKEDPFRLTPDPDYFFPSESHNLALKTLEYSTEQSEGFCVITGEPGTGKTTLLNVFLRSWIDKAIIALVLTPRLSPEEFLASVLDEMGLNIKAENKNELLKAFRNILIENVQRGKKIIIIVDEAQNLPTETLEELRLLSNLETEKEKLLQIILVGQPELEQKLNSPLLRQLNQRISTRVRLKHLDKKETGEYINFRLLKAGKSFIRFSDRAIREIYRITDGNPRLINIIGLRALMCAYMDDAKVVQKGHIKDAFKTLNTEGFKRRWRPSPVLISGFVAIVALLVFGLSEMNIISSDKVSFRGQEFFSPVQSKKESPEEVSPVVPESPQSYILVTAWEANLRVAPGIGSDKIGTVRRGTKLKITGEQIDKDGIKWYKVVVFNNMQAWISAKTGKVVTE